MSLSHLKKERYDVFAINPKKLEGINADITQSINGLLEVSLHKNYSITYAGNTIAIDYSDIQGIRIVAPITYDLVLFCAEGIDYSIIKPGASLKVYCSEKNEAKKYAFVINGKTYPLIAFFDKTAGNQGLLRE